MSNHTIPTITSVKDGNGNEVGQGATTSNPAVAINGTASSSDLIEIFDNDALAGKVFVAINGLWSFHFPVLSIGKHNIFAKNKTGASGVRSFEIIASK